MSSSLGLGSRAVADHRESVLVAPSPLERLLDETTELVCTTGFDGRITYVNRAWRRVLGYAIAELMTLRPVDLVATEDRMRYVDTARRLVRGETIEAFEATLMAKDGRRVVCRGRAVPEMVNDLTMPGGRRCVATYAAYLDLTAEREADAVRARLVATCEATSDVMAIAMLDGHMSYLNRAGRRLLGLADDRELGALHASDFYTPAMFARLVAEAFPVAASGGTWEGNSEVIGARGELIPVSIVIVVHPAQTAGGDGFVSAIMRDQRAQQAARAKLLASEAFSRSVVEASPDCVKTLDLDGSLLTMNGTGRCLNEVDDFCKIAGSDWAAQRSQGGVEVEARDAIAAAVDGRDGRFQGMNPTRTGTPKWWDVVITPILGADQQPERVLAVSREITELKRAEEAIQASEARHRELLSTLPLVVYRVEPTAPYTPIYVSAGIDTLGYTLDEWLASPDTWTRALHPEDRERVLRESAAAAETGAPLESEYRLLAKDGTVHWVHDRGEFMRDEDGRVVAWQGVMLDVTAGREAELALERERTFLASVLDSLSENVTVCDAVGRPILLNGTMRAHHGLPANDMPTADWWRELDHLFLPDGVTPLPIDARPHRRALMTGTDVDDVEFIIAPNGLPRRTMVANVRVLHGPTGEITGSVCAARDMTAQKAIEARLRDSETRVRGAIDASLDAVYIYRAVRDASGEIVDFEFTDCNAPGGEMFGMPHEDLIGHRLCELFPVMRGDETMNAFRRVVETGEAYVAERQARDPRTRAQWMRLQAVRVGDGLGVTARDVTDQKIVEDRLRALALVDELTGAPNRRGFMSLAEREWQRAQREKRGAVLAYIDLDGFKEINDTYGHAEGDVALCAVADVLRAAFRGADVIGRFGGDEFAVLVVPSGPPVAGAPSIAEVEQRVRERITHHLALSNADACAAGRPYDVAMCVGTAVVRPPADGGADDAPNSLAALMVLADERLYEAKRARDRRRTR